MWESEIQGGNSPDNMRETEEDEAIKKNNDNAGSWKHPYH